MRTTSRGIIGGSLVATVVALAALTGPASAASPCKGLEESACVGSSDCRWQAGYTRKDGIEVKSHCRSAGKKPAAADMPLTGPNAAPSAAPDATPASQTTPSAPVAEPAATSEGPAAEKPS